MKTQLRSRLPCSISTEDVTLTFPRLSGKWSVAALGRGTAADLHDCKGQCAAHEEADQQCSEGADRIGGELLCQEELLLLRLSLLRGRGRRRGRGRLLLRLLRKRQEIPM